MKVRSSQRIHISLDQREAEEICALVGGIRGTPKTETFTELFHALDHALPERTLSFSDLFEGEIRHRDEEDE